MRSNPLVGAWRLLSWENRSADGTISYVPYCGRYEFRDDSVIHHVELSLFPNWSGVDQERLVEVTGNRLTLRTTPFLLDGIEQSARLVWERV